MANGNAARLFGDKLPPRLRVFLKPDKSMDHFTFEQRTGYSAPDAAAARQQAR